MDLRRERSQRSGSPNATEPRPPSMSLAGTGGFSTVRRIQNVTTKAADQRLSKVMASQNSHNEEDHGFKFAPPYSTINTSSNLPEPSFARRNQSQLPALSRNPTVQATSTSPFRMPPQASLKPPSKDRVQRYFTAVPLVDSRDKVYQQEASAIRDELDMLQEENENVLEQLHRAEEKRKEAEARVRELENQVASLGEDVSLEAKLLSRKEAVLRQREAALKAAFEKKDEKKEEVLALCSELQILKDEAATAVKRIQEAESDVKALRTMAQRMVLTQDEMEEVALKRCWLARYWGLAVQHGIFADIAPSRHDKWSALAPLPFELVLSAAQKAKELSRDVGGSDQTKTARFLSDLTGEGNIECMLSVELGLRELASLQVEDAVKLAFAKKRTPSLVRQDSKGHGELRFVETYELKDWEKEDVAFKQAWLIYFWGRAKLHGVEKDQADERLQFWISRSEEKSPTSQDAIEVEQGLLKLRKLGIEKQLWEACREETVQLCLSSSPTSTLSDHNFDSLTS